MAICEIVTLPEPVLRRKARKVTNFGAALQNLIDDMVDTMRSAPGVGLAAPQVDISQRIIVLEYGDEDDESVPAKLHVIVNPHITYLSPETVVGAEGCLSVPGIVGDVERSTAVTVKGFSRHGQPLTIKAKGWLARIFQHEIDHLDGVMFVDRAEKIWKVVDEIPAQVIPAD